MRVGTFHLGYCTNVHPGETLEAVLSVLREDVSAVKSRVSPDAPFGTGLRLGDEATRALCADRGRLRALAGTLDDLGLYAFTVNGFPYGDFAADAVKEAVYEPSWLDPRRLDYTLRLAEVLVALPGPAERTISTVAGGFRPDTVGYEAEIAGRLEEAAVGLAELADRTGIAVRLCLEPEPWTTLETTDDALELWRGHLHGRGPEVREHLGLCYDCCHQAVHFEDPGESVRRLVDGGVPIGKVQVSSALHLADPRDPAARRALLAFDEPRYLHQTVGDAGGRLLRAKDLKALREPPPEWLSARAWRTHFHVPIWWEGADGLSTTRAEWQAAIAALAEVGERPHLEVETYTWHVIPDLTRFGGLHDCVARELEAVRAAATLPA